MLVHMLAYEPLNECVYKESVKSPGLFVRLAVKKRGRERERERYTVPAYNYGQALAIYLGAWPSN